MSKWKKSDEHGENPFAPDLYCKKYQKNLFKQNKHDIHWKFSHARRKK